MAAPPPPNFRDMVMVDQIAWLCNAMANVVVAVDDIRGNLAIARTEIQDLETQMMTDRNHFDQQLNLAGVDVTNTFNCVMGIEALVNTVITNQNLPPPGGAQGAGGQGGGQAGGQGGGQQQPPPLQPPINTAQVKMAKPDKFDGSKREELKKFMTLCRLFMDTNMSNHNEDQKVAFIISYLLGSARQWVQSYLEIDMLGNQVVLWLHDTTLFWREINARYGQINEGKDYRHDLKKLCQKGTVQDYLTEFQRLSAYLGYNDITLRDLFYDNLSMEVKLQLFSLISPWSLPYQSGIPSLISLPSLRTSDTQVEKELQDPDLLPSCKSNVRLSGENCARFRRIYALPAPAPAPCSGNAGFPWYPAKFLHLQVCLHQNPPHPHVS
ncbi:hypothetical protein FRC09_000728 [Ceratobasidium sp. 395]|nr:hypothetical protein FRC09_000728 [Ceratobasidium sp. 395]